jgi:hypothetical protein
MEKLFEEYEGKILATQEGIDTVNVYARAAKRSTRYAMAKARIDALEPDLRALVMEKEYYVHAGGGIFVLYSLTTSWPAVHEYATHIWE